MSKQSNPALIGAFVVGAVALLAVAVAVFGGYALFARKTVLVSYFDGSVKGLREGSDVVFRGVPVGFVRDIALLADVETLAPKIEVTMELIPDSIRVVRRGAPVERRFDEAIDIDRMVESGFSAQLGIDSIITGQLLVELDFRPGQRLELYGGRTPHAEIPSVPSNIQQAIARVQTLLEEIEENVDFATIGARLSSVLAGLDALANSQDLRAALEGLNRFVNAPETQTLSASLQATLGELRGLANQARGLVETMDGDVAALAEALKPAAGELGTALEQLQQTLEAVRRQAAGTSPQMYQLQSTLVEIEAAAESMREFFDELERRPESLLRGRRP